MERGREVDVPWVCALCAAEGEQRVGYVGGCGFESEERCVVEIYGATC